MISIKEYETGFQLKVQEFVCPLCGKQNQWKPNTQQSPYCCVQCNKIMMDITKMILEPKWRIVYHQEGEYAVRCNASI